MASENMGETANGQPETVDLEQHKGIQRKLNRAQEQNRNSNQALVEAAKANASVSRVEELVLHMVGQLSDDPSTLEAAQEKRQTEMQGFEVYSQLNAMLDENETDMSDERLENAATLWAEGRHTEALASAQSALTPQAVSQTDIEAQVAQAVQKALRGVATNVDMGSSDITPEGDLTEADLVAFRRQGAVGASQASVVGDAQKLLDKFFR